MLMPALLYFVIFRVTAIIGMKLAFYDYKIVGDNTFVGMKYFKMLFDTPAFWNIMKNTLLISSIKIFLLFPFPVSSDISFLPLFSPLFLPLSFSVLSLFLYRDFHFGQRSMLLCSINIPFPACSGGNAPVVSNLKSERCVKENNLLDSGLLHSIQGCYTLLRDYPAFFYFPVYFPYII